METDLPNYIKFDGRLYIIDSVIYKRGQAYYKITNGMIKHASFFEKITKSDLIIINRENKLKQILSEN